MRRRLVNALRTHPLLVAVNLSDVPTSAGYGAVGRPSGLVPGEMIVRKDGRGELLAAGEGLVEITGDSVSVVTDMAVPDYSIDEAKSEQARQQAEARLHEKISAQEIAYVQAALAHSLAQIHVRGRHRKI